MINKELIQKLFRYEDGFLYWLTKPSPQVDISKPAGTFSKGHRAIRIKSKHYLSHRLIFLLHYGYLPKIVEHIDRDRGNSRVENLRPATQSQNLFNTTKNIGNKCGYKGVIKINNRYRARLGRMHLGYFDTPEVAAMAYDDAVEKNVDEGFRMYNFPIGRSR